MIVSKATRRQLGGLLVVKMAMWWRTSFPAVASKRPAVGSVPPGFHRHSWAPWLTYGHSCGDCIFSDQWLTEVVIGISRWIIY